MKRFFTIFTIFTISSILLLFPIILIFFSKYFTIDLLTEGWLGFLGGYLGAILSIFGSIFAMKFQLEEEKKIELERTRPILILGQNILFNYGMDSLLREDEYKFPLLRLINGGNSPLLNIEISYEISNSTLLELQRSGAINSFTSDFIFSKNLGMPYSQKKVISIIGKEEQNEFFLYDELLMKLILLHYKDLDVSEYEDFVIFLAISYEDNFGKKYSKSYEVQMQFEEIVSSGNIKLELVRGRTVAHSL